MPLELIGEHAREEREFRHLAFLVFARHECGVEDGPVESCLSVCSGGCLANGNAGAVTTAFALVSLGRLAVAS